MPNPNFHTLLSTLEQHANPLRAVPMKAYMKNKFEFLGIAKPQLTKIAKPWITINKKDKDIKVSWDFVQSCWQCPYRELQYCALVYLQNTKHLLTPDDIPRLQALITDKSWWDTSDVLDRIVGDIALRYPLVNDVLLAWSVSDNLWLRRVAIDHQLLRKARTDTALLERILVNNLGSKEFFINKAIGWAMRDYSKTDSQWVRSFIERYRDDMASLSIREASRYL